MFTGAYYIQWFQKPLTILQENNIGSSVIILNNAKYHTVIPKDMPRGQWQKMAMITFCNNHNIPVEERDTKSIVWSRIKDWSVQNINPVIQSMAEAAGHRILWMPPYHSNLPPIEMVWANMKGKVGQQYTDKTTFAQVKQQLN